MPILWTKYLENVSKFRCTRAQTTYVVPRKDWNRAKVPHFVQSISSLLHIWYLPVCVALCQVNIYLLGQFTSKTVWIGLSCDSKQSLFGWICHPEMAWPLKKKTKNFFFNAKTIFWILYGHLKGSLGSPNQVSNQIFASVRAHGGHFRYFEKSLNSP